MCMVENYDVMVDEYLQREAATKSLYEFVKQSWHVIEPVRPFVDGWHIGAICEHLEAVYRREIRNLLINQPPRTMKSSLLSVFFQPWVWCQAPNNRFLYSCYAATLTIRDAVLSRRLIESSWYQKRYGEVFSFAEDQNAKARYLNNKGGYRLSISVDGSATGEGGDFLIADDPNNAKDGESDASRNSTNHWWDTAYSNRLEDPKTSCRIVSQQRLHEKDISGHIMDNDSEKEWVKLILPMEYEKVRRCKTIPLPSTKGKLWEDPRQEEGELLWPHRMGEKELKSLKASLKTQYNIAGQLQQRPAPEDGGILKKSYFKWWKQPAPPKIEHVIQSWDPAMSIKEDSCYSACTTWGLFKSDNGIMNIILLSMWRGIVEYPELRKMAQRLYFDYRDDDVKNEIKPDGHHVPDVVLVESKASGISLVQDFLRAGIVATRFFPDKFGDKIERVRRISHFIENGRVWVAARPPDYMRLRASSDIFVEQCAKFPRAESRDLVDTLTQVLLRLSSSGWITHTEDTEIEDKYTPQPRAAYYD